MGFVDEFISRGVQHRLTEELIYAEVFREMESGFRRDGLWAKALSEAKFDENDAKSRYIKLRVQSIRDDYEFLIRQKSSTGKGGIPQKSVVLQDNSPGRTQTPSAAIPSSSEHTAGVYSCNHCDYYGKLLVVKSIRTGWAVVSFFAVSTGLTYLLSAIFGELRDTNFLIIGVGFLGLGILTLVKKVRRKTLYCPVCGNRDN
jgi:hypothetical protein